MAPSKSDSSRVAAILNKTTDRRSSVIATHQHQPRSAWEVSSVDQLVSYVNEDPEDFWRMIKTLREERDEMRTIAEWYTELKKAKTAIEEQLENALEDVSNANDRASEWRDRNRDLHTRLNEVTRQILDDEQDDIPADVPARDKKATQQPKAEKSSKLPDPPMFSDGIKVKWDDWYAKMVGKLAGNADHYPTEELKIEYVCLRVEGDASDYTLARRFSGCLSPYTHHTQVFEDLAEVYEDSDRIANSDRQLHDLQMDSSDKFIDFYSQYVRLSTIIGTPAHLQIGGLVRKLPDRLRKLAQSHNPPFTSLKLLKESLLRMDNTQRSEYQQALTKSTTRDKAKKGLSSSLSSRAMKSPVTSVTASVPGILKPVTSGLTRKTESKYGCYKCGKLDHMARECKEEH